MFDYTTIGLECFLYPSMNLQYVIDVFYRNTQALKKIIMNIGYPVKFNLIEPYKFKFENDGTIIKQRIIEMYQKYLFINLNILLIDSIVNPFVEQVYIYTSIYNAVRKYYDWKIIQTYNFPFYLKPKQKWNKINFI